MSTSPDSARLEVLSRISAALGREQRDEAPASAAQVHDCRTSGEKDSEALIALLTDRLIDYNAGVHPVEESAVGAKVAELAGNASAVVVPHDLPQEWLSGLTAAVECDSPAQPQPLTVLDSVDAVVTGSTVAIADTGTICLAGPLVGRRAITLVPDHHICILRVADIVEIVPQAVSILRERGLAEVPQTWVSGPSATVDIELERVKGVHGPRTLDVILVR